MYGCIMCNQNDTLAVCADAMYTDEKAYFPFNTFHRTCIILAFCWPHENKKVNNRIKRRSLYSLALFPSATTKGIVRTNTGRLGRNVRRGVCVLFGSYHTSFG